jgi:hypothetical protein
MPLAELEGIDTNKLRKRTVEIARNHKASWIELGQFLYTIFKNKMYKTWGFLTFEGYCKSELGIKETTASKLLKSYYFLENEEPALAKEPFSESNNPKVIPNYESVNLLRLAKQNKNVSESDFAELRQAVLSENKEPKEVRVKMRKIIAENGGEEKDPADIRRDRRNTSIKRLITFLSNTKKEFEGENLLPAFLLKQIADLTAKLQDQLEQ